MGVLLTYISEYRICELTRTVHTVTESKTYTENTVVCHFDMLENAHFNSRPRIHQIPFGGRAPPGPAGGAYRAPPDP